MPNSLPTFKKTADQLRQEFFDALARDSAEHKAALARDSAEHKAALARDRAERNADMRDFKEKLRLDAEARRAEAEERKAAYREEDEARKKSAAEHDRQMATIRSEWGGFTNNEGKSLEDDVLYALERLGVIGGLRVVDTWSSFRASKKTREYDGLVHCPNEFVLLEVKRHFTVEAVQKFVAEQLRDFRADYPYMINGKALYGAVAGLVVDDEARELAASEGLFVLRVGGNREVQVLHAPAP